MTQCKTFCATRIVFYGNNNLMSLIPEQVQHQYHCLHCAAFKTGHFAKLVHRF